MSLLTAQLVPASKVPSCRTHWLQVFAIVADRLVAEYGVPSLGNRRDPVQEIFYITLSARTTDSQYRKTYRALRSRFPTLADLSAAPIEDILSCIADGGLGKKRAAQVRGIATKLLTQFGNASSRRLRRMTAHEVFDVLTGLPGMGPKSALCVMMYSLNHDTFPVDVSDLCGDTAPPPSLEACRRFNIESFWRSRFAMTMRGCRSSRRCVRLRR